MINENDLKLLRELSVDKISEQEFIKMFSYDISYAEGIDNVFKDIYESKDSQALIASFSLHKFHQDSFKSREEYYLKFAYADWHCWHEWLMTYLKLIGTDDCVDAIYHIAITPHELIDSEDRENLAVQCTYSLANIASKRAIERLQLLSKSDNERIKSEALMRLSEIGAV